MAGKRHDAPARRRGGFTLIEVMLVLVILGVIAALVVPRMLGTQERANIMATKTKISQVEQSIELYAVEHDATHPESLEELVNPVDLNGNAMKPYEREFPKDAWRQNLNYESSVDDNAGGANVARIWSNGPNRRDDGGGGDDINNWSEREESR
ncbi:MAG: type II secretion system protein GspG [Pirellulales bacterium]|nr:type II secretion system protein GspG [Planctomycetales bacterium]